MANIHDYLRWRGDIAFGEHPFNDVDNLVLSALVYLDFSGIVPIEGSDGSISVADACKALLDKSAGDVKPFVRSLAKVDTAFVQLVRTSQRFGNARLSAYVDVVSANRALQFAAMQVSLPDAGDYLALRGTDTTIVGWRENLMTSFRITEAQQEAARYVERALTRSAKARGSVRVGGHSKGGNLAEYAAATCPEQLRQRIVCVYSNDGPGMAPEVMPRSPREILGERLRLIVPTYSMVGMLFARKNEHRTIVASSASGIEQHDITTWQVLRDGVEEADALEPDCVTQNDAIAEWASGIALDERERVTNEVFDILQAGGAKTFEQILASPDQLQRVLRGLGSLDERTRALALALVQRSFDSSVGAMRTAALKAVEDAGRRLLGTRPLHAGTINARKGRPGLKVFIDS